MPKEQTSSEILNQPLTEILSNRNTTSGDGSSNTAGANTFKAPEQTNEKLLINNIVIRSIDRTPKDVGTWRNAHQAAENIYYPNRTRLYDLYMDVILDGHLSGIMMKRIDTVLNKSFRYVSPNNDEIEPLCQLTHTLPFRTLLRELMQSVFWGVSGIEFIPGQEFTFRSIPRKHIKPEQKVIAINQTDFVGVPYDNLSNVWVIGEERDLGLLLKCAFYALLKKGSYADWANYVEIFGQPVIVTKYDAYDEKSKAQLTNLLNDIGSSLRVNIPKQCDFEIVDGKFSNGNGDLQEKFVNSCNDEMSVLILGNTETTKSSKSSGFAQSQTHSKQQIEVTKSDLHFILALLNSTKFTTILKSYGFPVVQGGQWVSDEEVDVNELQTRASVLTQLKTSYGLPIDDDYLYETFSIPRPDNYDELKAKAEAQQQNTPSGDGGNKPDGEGNNKPIKPSKENGKKGNNARNTPSGDGGNSLSVIDKFRLTLADFFDHAHKD